MSAGRILIAGVSTRAAADSAARAGFEVIAVDAFGDLDQHPAVDARALRGRFTVHAAVEAVRDVECDAVAYLAPFENHLDAVRALAANRRLWGNPPEVVQRVRDPIVVAHVLRERGLLSPHVRLKPDATAAISSDVASGFSRTDWLLKPLASGGGHGIRRWHEGDRVPRGCYLQELIEGVAGSVVFVAANRRAVPLGVLRQLIGDGAFGASSFEYCGNILDPHMDEAVATGGADLAHAVAEAFALVGVNGIDFVARDGVPYAVEVNPRWCASMELVERAYGIGVFAMHAAACDQGTLPAFDLSHTRRMARGAFGKAIVFARQDVTAGTFDTDEVRDIPRPGTRLRAGRPICTVFATAPDAAACYTALVQRAERVYQTVRGGRL